MKKQKSLLVLILLLAASVVFLTIVLPYIQKKIYNGENKGGLDMVIINHGDEISKSANEFNIPSEYLEAVCMLETAGKKNIESRYEKHVFRRLKKVRDGEMSYFESITKDMIADASDEALKNLASSWGPFQLMGYKCLHLGIKVKDIRGVDAVYYVTQWINLTYGEYLRKGQFKDAFHLHNAGKKIPKSGGSLTHDPNYIKNGMKYLAYFRKLEKK